MSKFPLFIELRAPKSLKPPHPVLISDFFSLLQDQTPWKSWRASPVVPPPKMCCSPAARTLWAPQTGRFSLWHQGVTRVPLGFQEDKNPGLDIAEGGEIFPGKCTKSSFPSFTPLKSAPPWKSTNMGTIPMVWVWNCSVQVPVEQKRGGFHRGYSTYYRQFTVFQGNFFPPSVCNSRPFLSCTFPIQAPAEQWFIVTETAEGLWISHQALGWRERQLRQENQGIRKGWGPSWAFSIFTSAFRWWLLSYNNSNIIININNF